MEKLIDVIGEVAKYVGDNGACPDDRELVLGAINRARRILYPLGEWKGIVNDIVIQSYGGTITLPCAYEFITKAHYSMRNMEIPNEWFSIVTNDFESCCGAMCRPSRMNEPVVTFRDFTMDYKDECFFRVEIMFESEQEAEGTEIILHGYNKQGGRETLRRIYPTEQAYEGVTAGPIADVYMRSLYQVHKGVTEGRVRVYEYIPDTDKRILAAIYEKDDVNPTLTRYRVSRGRSTTQFAVSAKRKYRPIVNDNDPVDINTESLIHTLQALSERDSKNIAGFNLNLNMATQYLQRELGGEDSREPGHVRLGGPRNTNLVDCS